MRNKHPISIGEERILIQKAKNGCQSSFEQLVKNDSEASKNYLRKYFTNEDYIEEAYSKALLKAWVKLSDFEGKCRFRTWFSSILRNAALDEARVNNRVEKIDINVLDSNSNPSEEVDYRAFHHYKELSMDSEVYKKSNEDYAAFSIDLLKKHVDNLPPKNKRCLFLFMDGYSYEEIAEMENIPIGTVMSRIFLARSKFKKQLQNKLKNSLTNSELGAIIEHELLSSLLQGKNSKRDKSTK